MKIRLTLAATALALTLSTSGLAVAQNHDDHHDNGYQNNGNQNNGNHDNNHHDNGNRDNGNHGNDNRYVRHDDWKRGRRMNHDDWNRGQVVDYRQYHLAPPRRGYQWRSVDGNYVMAAVATGLIASVIVASASH